MDDGEFLTVVNRIQLQLNDSLAMSAPDERDSRSDSLWHKPCADLIVTQIVKLLGVSAAPRKRRIHVLLQAAKLKIMRDELKTECAIPE